jgi:hypothetical protein
LSDESGPVQNRSRCSDARLDQCDASTERRGQLQPGEQDGAVDAAAAIAGFDGGPPQLGGAAFDGDPAGADHRAAEAGVEAEAFAGRSERDLGRQLGRLGLPVRRGSERLVESGSRDRVRLLQLRGRIDRLDRDVGGHI